MPEKIAGLPWWMPAWLWRITHHVWFASVAFGLMAYFALSLINDALGTLPLWVRLATGVLTGLLFRLGMFLQWRRATQEPKDSIFDVLVASGLPFHIAARAEEHANTPDLHAALQRTISIVFWLAICVLVEFAVIVGLVIELISE
jgi:hypothetical protein